MPLGERLVETLKTYQAEVRPRLAGEGESALWVHSGGRRMREHTVGQVLTQAARLAGLKRVTAHSLRHAYATHLLTRGAPLWVVQHLQGQERSAMTAHYTRLLAADVEHELLRTHPRARKAKPKAESESKD